MLGIPDVAGAAVSGWAFEPPCHEPGYPDHPPKFPNQGHCSGDWMHNLTMYDYLRVPEHLKPGSYVLGFRCSTRESNRRPFQHALTGRSFESRLRSWDCETSAQVWQSCADVKLTAPKGGRVSRAPSAR